MQNKNLPLTLLYSVSASPPMVHLTLTLLVCFLDLLTTHIPIGSLLILELKPQNLLGYSHTE